MGASRDQCPDDPLLLGWGNAGEYICLLDSTCKSVTVHAGDLIPLNNPGDREIECSTDITGHELVITGYDLYVDAGLAQHKE